jgi:hypothetical protein
LFFVATVVTTKRRRKKIYGKPHGADAYPEAVVAADERAKQHEPGLV